VIYSDGRPTIVDTPLTLISKMWQGAFHFHFCLSRQPILRVCLYTTCRHSNYPRCTTNNRWCSVDAHFCDGAGMVLQPVLPIRAAKNSFMTDCNVSAVLWPRMHDQTLLTLPRGSFSGWGRQSVDIIFDNIWRLIPWLCITTTESSSNYQTYMT